MAKVLVVDDDYHFRNLFCELLRTEGCAVISASSGKEALMLMGDTAAASETLALCIVDFHMGDMNGFDLIQELRKNEKVRNTPIIMLTSTKKNIKELVESEGVQFLEKSMHYKALLGKVREALGPNAPAACAAPDSQSSTSSPQGAMLPLNIKFQNLILRCLEFDKSKRDRSSGRVSSLGISAVPQSPVPELVKSILDELVDRQSSDAVFELREQVVEMRMQTQGTWEAALNLPVDLFNFVMMNIVNLARLNIIQLDQAQQGNLPWQAESGKAANFRVSISPTETGFTALNLHVD